MLDVEKHLRYWRASAANDESVGDLLIAHGKSLHAAFFGHLFLEKALKALVTKVTGNIPPYTHDLARLAELAQIAAPEELREFLTVMNRYNIGGRYPDARAERLPEAEIKADYQRAKEVLRWLLNQ